MALSNKEKQSTADSNRREAGLVQVKAWIPKELKPSLRSYEWLLRGCKTVAEYVKDHEDNN